MQSLPLIHVVTARENCEPRGVTLAARPEALEGILDAIARQELDTFDASRGLCRVLQEVYRWTNPPREIDFSVADCEGGNCNGCLTIDFVRSEVALSLNHDKTMRCDLTAAAVRPLLEKLQDLNSCYPYYEEPSLPERATVRIIVERSGTHGCGVDLHHPVNGSSAVLELLEMLGRCWNASLDNTLLNAWCAESGFATVVPLYEPELGDEYVTVTPVTAESDCPLLTIDLCENSLRLSDPDGHLIMVTDPEPEAIERVRIEFEKRTRTSRLAFPPFDYGPHPDYPVMSVENAPF